MVEIEDDQDFVLSSGRKTMNRRVLMPQPVTVLISDNCPSPRSLQKQRSSSLGIGSDCVTGRPTMCIASGTTFAAHCALLFWWRVTGMRSSM